MNDTSYSLVQAIRGPIMLITLGTLVAMDYFGRLWIQPDLADVDHHLRYSEVAGKDR